MHTVGRKTEKNFPDKVIFEIPKSENLQPLAVARFKQAYEYIKEIDHDGVVKIFNIIEYKDRFSIVQENFNAVSLDKAIIAKPVDIVFFLNIAVSLSHTLGILHEKNIIHKAINPCNIYLNKKNSQVKISNFGIISELTNEHEDLMNPAVIENILPYISPEQTGRINVPIDHRTDLYSLGIVFYEMLTSNVPFKSDDSLEIIYSHIARKPIPPNFIVPDIPDVLSEIIIKLLSKSPDERYQNAFSLKLDLMECLKQVEKDGTIHAFHIAQKDFSDKFIIPQKLYGRDREIAIIMSLFEQVSKGENKLLFVTGDPGIGKSSLINEIRKLFITKQGYFISGKFEQLKADEPYSAIIQAFKLLTKQILSESDDSIKIWKETLVTTLGPNGKIITDLFPEMELIIGKQPAVTELEPESSRNRFNYVFEQFLGVFAKKDHPFILFLDDVQWSDPASIQLLKHIKESLSIKHLFIIGAYRDNEVSDTHPLNTLYEKTEWEQSPIHNIRLSTIASDDIKQLIADIFKCSQAEADSLGAMVFTKTGGNPFFVNQFLKILYEKKYIKLDPDTGWEWDEANISGMHVTDNLANLLLEKIHSLSKQTQEVVKVCACIGSGFDLKTVSAVCNTSMDTILLNLKDALNEGIITDVGDGYLFQHDKIQEAAYSLIPKDKKGLLHYQIGKFTMENENEKDLQGKLFYIVDHLNLGLDFLLDDDRVVLIKLNFKAGEKAKASAAYESSLDYLKMGIGLLGEKSWESHYDLTLDLYTEAAEAAYLCADFDYIRKTVPIVLGHANSLLDKIKIYEIKLKSYNAQNRPSDVIKEGLDVLRLLGYNLSDNPTKLHVIWRFIDVWTSLRNKKIDELTKINDVTDPKILLVHRILSVVLQAAYRTLPKLTLITGFLGVKLTLKYGISPLSAFYLAGYGMLLCDKLGQINAGYNTINLALLFNNRPISKKFKARAIYLSNAMTLHWKEHYENILKPLQDVYKIALENGDIEFAAFAGTTYCHYSYCAGKPLENCAAIMKTYDKILHQFNHKTHLHYLEIFHQTILNLLGETNDPCYLKGDIYNEDSMLPIHMKANDKTAVAALLFQKIVLNFLFDRYAIADGYTNDVEKLINSVMGQAWIPIFYFYDSLSRLAVFLDSSKAKRRRYKRIITANQKKMKKWAIYAPMNFLNKFYLVEAEQARVNNNILLAEKYYTLAIEKSQENRYIQEEALANELAAKFHLSRNNKKAAWLYMQDTYNCYSKWGAKAKLKHLEETYPDLLIQPQHKEATSTSLLDIATVIRASQAISSEIAFRKLLRKMMGITIEHAGAQKGYLIFQSSKGLYIEAEFTAEIGQISMLESIPLDTHTGISSGVVHYVARTKETMILNNPALKGEFINDSYILENQPKSILCMPIRSKGEIIAIIYLENNLTANAFTPEHLEVLNHLSTQMAISLDNAKLYENLEEKVEERTLELQNALDELEILNKALARSRDEKEKQLQLLIDNLKSVVYRFANDKNQTITFISEGCFDLLGYEPMDFLNTPGLLRAIIHPEDIAEYAHRIRVAARERRGYQVEYRIIKPSGNEKWIWEQCECVISDVDNIILFEGLLIDITDRKSSIAALKESEQIKSEFITTASHELRTPLHIMKLSLSGLLEGYSGQISPEVKDDLMIIQMGIDRMTKIVETFLDVTKIEARQSNRIYENVSLLEIINTSIVAIYGLLKESDHSLLLNIKTEKHILLHADKERLIQVMINLLSNAVKYTPEDSVIIINVALNKNQVTIKVADNGYGIPEWAQEKIFQKFFQADYVMPYKVGGLGLGLSISQAIVAQHNGKLHCQSPVPKNSFDNLPLDEKRKGSIFILDLPIHINSKLL